MKSSALFSISLSVLVLSLTACQSTPIKEEMDVASAPTIPVTQELSSDINLESRVSTLEQQMKIAQPTLKKVEAMETHFKALSFELDKIAETYKIEEPAVENLKASSPVTISAPVSTPALQPVEKPVEKKEVKKTAPVPTGFSVTSVRIGEQDKNITRIVLDTTKPAEINYDLDNVEGLLVIEIPKAAWSTTTSQVFQKSPMVKSFKALDDEKGSRFVADLKQKAKVVATARLSPSGASGYRVYIDIAPAQ